MSQVDRVDQNATLAQYEQYLNILAIFNFIIGGIAGLFACFPVIHLVTGISMLLFGLVPGLENRALFFPTGIIGLFFVIVATVIIALGWAFAISLILAGYGLLKRRWYTFCLVMAGVACMFMPFGTVLGVLTLILLLKPEVKLLFEARPAV